MRNVPFIGRRTADPTDTVPGLIVKRVQAKSCLRAKDAAVRRCAERVALNRGYDLREKPADLDALKAAERACDGAIQRLSTVEQAIFDTPARNTDELLEKARVVAAWIIDTELPATLAEAQALDPCYLDAESRAFLPLWRDMLALLGGGRVRS
jgi:hypothetical protein